MGEEVTLAGRLRAIASDVEHGARESSAFQLREVARRWEEARLIRAGCCGGWTGPEGDVKCDPCPLAPAPGPQDPQPRLGGKSPADRIVRVLATARALVKAQGMATVLPGPMHDLANALDALDAALQEEAREMGTETAGHWEPATWRDTRAGDRIRVAGQHVAEVEVALPLTWLGSGAAQVPVKLKDRGHYVMPPTGPVDIWRPALPDWAGQAFLALVEGGLTNA